MSEHYVADAYALLAFFAGQPGGDRVAAILADPDNTLHVSSINLGEVYYILLRRHGPVAAQDVERDVFDQPNVEVVDSTWERIRAAAAIKAGGGMSFADAFAAALAQELDATLVTGDPEFEPLERQRRLRILWLPRR